MDIIAPGTNLPIVTPNSPEGRERAKWEQDFDNPFQIRPLPREQGGRYPRVHQDYPKAMYKAGRPDHANLKIVDFQLAADAQAEAVLEGQGYRWGQQAALDHAKACDVEHAKLAAERHWQEAKMSPKAQAEAQAVDQETVYHVPMIPETPIKRRGRKPKAAVTEG